MAGLTGKERAALAYLYELDEFKAFKKLVANKRVKVAEMLVQKDVSQPGALAQIAMLQGQAYALEYLILEMQQIHKKEIAKATAEQKK